MILLINRIRSFYKTLNNKECTMPNMMEIAGTLAGILAIIAFVPYIIAILRKQTRPNRATWWIWTVVDGLILGSYYCVGARDTIWVPVSFFVGALIIAILSLKWGEKGWKKIDVICLIAAGISVVLWFVASTPLVILLINLGIMALGGIPTIRKAFINPASENKLAWTFFFTACVLNFFAVETWEFAIVVYPICVFLIDGIIALLLFFPRGKNKN